jgi:phage shock protein A
MSVDLRTTGNVNLSIVRALQAELAKQDSISHRLELRVMELTSRIEQLETELRTADRTDSTVFEKVVQNLCETPT